MLRIFCIREMNGMEVTLPKRKHPRMQHYDYSSGGMYFVTLCTHLRKNLLSLVADGPAEDGDVGRGLAPAEMRLTRFGEIAQHELLALENRYDHIEIGAYVIMPNHIHAIIGISNAAGASPRPTLMDVICALKSLTVRQIRKMGYTGEVFQTSFYERVIRSQNEYLEIVRYIEENPMKWGADELYQP